MRMCKIFGFFQWNSLNIYSEIFLILKVVEEVKEKDNEEVKAEADSSVESSEEKKEENGDVEKTAEAEEKPVENGSGK